MPPDRPHPLATAAAWRRAAALGRAQRALRELGAAGEPVTVQAVARRAGVSRQWLYQQPQLRADIERLRALPGARGHDIPQRERATEASLHQRVEALLDENRRLRQETIDLQAELAIAYGRQRAER